MKDEVLFVSLAKYTDCVEIKAKSQHMYSFGPLPKVGKSGRIIGAHQKIDRVARRHLISLLPVSNAFPDSKTILHFEGIRGPDGAKLKSPGIDEPWHFINPQNAERSPLLVDIENHRANLTVALKKNDTVRAGFEAAWLAHAITDGLTPAHHQAHEEEIFRAVRDAVGSNRNVRSRVVMSGDGTAKDFVRSNWSHWGAGGTMSTHTMFEGGVATTIKGLRFASAKPTGNDIIRIKREGLQAYFLESLRHVDHLHMYESFQKKGWTSTLARQTNEELMPVIIRTVTLAWYYAAWKSELGNK